MATTKYNPYNAVKSISDLKGKWHTARDMGQDYSPYATEATQYYNELRENGYGDVADELTANDYIGSLDILARYKPDTDFEIDTVYNDLMGSASDIASGKTTPAASDSVTQILDSFKNTDDRLNGDIRTDADGNVVGGLNLDHYNTGKDQLDFINEFDYTKQSYFDPIMKSFQLQGDDAAKGKLADGASSNGGNIDSYAAANANRQQLAFTNAGHEAARAAAQQNQDNWQKLYDSMSGNLSDMGAINSQNLGIGANMYATDSAERQNAMNTAAGLADSEAARQLEQYLAELDDKTTRYGIDAETKMNDANNAAAMEQLLKQIEAEVSMNESNNATTRYGVDAEVGMNAANNAAELERLIKEIDSQRELAGMNNQAELDKLIKEYDLAAQYGTTSGVGTGAIAETEYTPDELALNLFAGGKELGVKSWNDYYRMLVENGVSAKEAKNLMDIYEELYGSEYWTGTGVMVNGVPYVDRFTHD